MSQLSIIALAMACVLAIVSEIAETREYTPAMFTAFDTAATAQHLWAIKQNLQKHNGKCLLVQDFGVKFQGFKKAAVVKLTFNEFDVSFKFLVAFGTTDQDNANTKPFTKNEGGKAKGRGSLLMKSDKKFENAVAFVEDGTMAMTKGTKWDADHLQINTDAVKLKASLADKLTTWITHYLIGKEGMEDTEIGITECPPDQDAGDKL